MAAVASPEAVEAIMLRGGSRPAERVLLVERLGDGEVGLVDAVVEYAQALTVQLEAQGFDPPVSQAEAYEKFGPACSAYAEAVEAALAFLRGSDSCDPQP